MARQKNYPVRVLISLTREDKLLLERLAALRTEGNNSGLVRLALHALAEQDSHCGRCGGGYNTDGRCSMCGEC